MRDRLRYNLGRLASREYQRRWIVDADASEYDLPEEILNDIITTIEIMLDPSQSISTLNEQEIRAIKECLQVLNSTDLPVENSTITAEDLIENNPDWNTARESAQKCLQELNLHIDLQEIWGNTLLP